MPLAWRDRRTMVGVTRRPPPQSRTVFDLGPELSPRPPATSCQNSRIASWRPVDAPERRDLDSVQSNSTSGSMHASTASRSSAIQPSWKRRTSSAVLLGTPLLQYPASAVTAALGRRLTRWLRATRGTSRSRPWRADSRLAGRIERCRDGRGRRRGRRRDDAAPCPCAGRSWSLAALVPCRRAGRQRAPRGDRRLAVAAGGGATRRAGRPRDPPRAGLARRAPGARGGDGIPVRCGQPVDGARGARPVAIEGIGARARVDRRGGLGRAAASRDLSAGAAASTTRPTCGGRASGPSSTPIACGSTGRAARRHCRTARRGSSAAPSGA